MTSSNTDPLVSVVIPTYERSQFLEGAIQTALGQTYENIEVIVVDDGSSEQYSDKIVSDYSDNVNCLQHEENKGLSAARNTGIRESGGEFVAFLDDDDRWHKTKLARQVEALKQDQTVGLATCLVAAITPDNELVHCETSAPSGDCSETILSGNSIGTPSRILVRQDCFKDIGCFDESLPTKQDWDFYIRLCQNWRVAAVEDHLCFRTIHESMSSNPESAQRDNEQILHKHEELFRSRGYSEKAKSEIAMRVGRAYMRTAKLSSARNQFGEAIKQDMTLQRILLYLLTFTHPILINKLRNIKRRLSIQQSGCSNFGIVGEISSEAD